MKKDNINLILAGVGVLVALIMLPKGEKRDGSESGGFQLPTIFPTGTGAGTGEAAPAGTTNYNISFPDFPGFPTGETKKDTVISGVGSLGVPYTGFGYDPTTQVYTSGLGSGVPGYEPLKSTSHAPSSSGIGSVDLGYGGLTRSLTPAPISSISHAPAVSTTKKESVTSSYVAASNTVFATTTLSKAMGASTTTKKQAVPSYASPKIKAAIAKQGSVRYGK